MDMANLQQVLDVKFLSMKESLELSIQQSIANVAQELRVTFQQP